MIGRLIAAALLAACWWTAPAAARSEAPLEAVLAQWDADPHPDLRGVVVMRDGRIVAERYYNGANAEALHDIRSAGKSVTALLVGIAVDRGAIRSVDDPVSAYWPEAQGSAIGDVALRDVLTMRSGLAAFDEDPKSPGNEDRMDEAADPLAFVRAVPRVDPPGSRYRYNSLTSYVAGVVTAKATGRRLADVAAKHLFDPLGIRRWQWASDAAGYTKAQGNLMLTTRDLATLGEMVRGRGLYRERRIVSAGWIDAALAPRVSIAADDPYADGYGYYWYSKVHEVDGVAVPVSFASGNGGNKIYVVPSRRLVVAITSAAYGRGYGQRRSQDILKAVLAADLAASR
ncbi:CubicO group peptidase (beta-lactamase class C family) [Sphingomonas zeicaulis]|uniref:serine hydrolase domain-containing protein n=1 Tax=Sphingomonas zeicaulis TaxID=1632740 RepID=UPI003D2513DA